MKTPKEYVWFGSNRVMHTIHKEGSKYYIIVNGKKVIIEYDTRVNRWEAKGFKITHGF